MNHLFISREYPPSPYPTGGIGTYLGHMSHALAAHGERVHVIAQQSPAAPRSCEDACGGRLTIHRVDPASPLPDAPAADAPVLRRLLDSAVPAQAFMWQAARLAETLIAREGIDLIEAQEFETPAYFLLVRRALGAAAGQRVPIVVHLHSPTELVLGANEWRTSSPDRAPLIDMERFSIRAADALICPSRYLARSVEAHYGLGTGAVEVIPYPIPDVDVVVRGADVWRTGTICYAGRLEPRKGVFEWLDAAIAVAGRSSAVTFTFAGGDTASNPGAASVGETMRARIPAALRPRFRFTGALDSNALRKELAQARIAVVPSRWENFPYSCIEAMASGLPVLVTPTGGMMEMVGHGTTGWIAPAGDAASLAAALDEALAVPPAALAAMGGAAAASIRDVCRAETVVARHLEFKRAVVSRGVQLRSSLRANLPCPGPVHAGGSDAAPIDGEEAVMRHACLEPAGDRAISTLRGERPMTLMDIARAPRHQRLAVIRRALRDPSHVGRWLAWQIGGRARRRRP